MSAVEGPGGPVAGVAQQDIGSILRAAPKPLLLLVLLFLVGGLVGGAMLLHPEWSRMIYRQSLMRAFSDPFTRGTILGTDQLGRVLEWRLLAGLAISLGTAAVVTAIATVLGMIMGILGGFYGRTADRVVNLVIDVTWAYPTLLLAVVVAGIIGPGVWTVIIALGLTLWAAMARIVRAQVLVLREMDYVLAARALGYSRTYIALRHMVPNLMPIWILMATLFVALTIIAESGLSFIGIGAQSPTPSLGKTLAEGFSFASSSAWPLVFGSITIVALVTVLNGFGDYLGDAIDPRRRVTGRLALLPPRPRWLMRPDNRGTVAAPVPEAPLLSADDVTVAAVAGGPGRAAVPVLSDFSLRLEAGRTLGIVGESGSGKSVAARALTGLLPSGLAPVGGKVLWAGEDIAALSPEALRARSGKFVAMAFQDARASLDPLYTIGNQIAEVHRAHSPSGATEARREVAAILDRVGLSPAETFAGRYPHQLSGGQLQRAALAAALIAGPRVLICDEPTTGLDATTQKVIVDLVTDLQREMGMAVIWISHDLDLVAAVADDLMVMYAGQVVETGPAGAVLRAPRHPYTRGLIDSRPDFDRTPKTPLPAIPGNVPEPTAWPPACRFAPRCGRAEARCTSHPPSLDSVSDGRQLRCFNPIPAEGT